MSNVKVYADYEPALPTISALWQELISWTALIENALDALGKLAI